MEAAGLAHAAIVIVESRNDALNRIANFVVVVCELFPVYGGAMFERCACESRHDLRLTQKLLRRRLERSARDLHHAHRILRRDKLKSSRLLINLRATEAWQN